MKMISSSSYWKLIVCALASALVVVALAGCSPSSEDESADATADSAPEAVENEANSEESPDEVGIESSADAIFEFANGDNEAAEAESSADSASGDSASGDTIIFGGISFVVPDGWSTTIDGSDMEVVIPFDGTNVAKIVISQFPFEMTKDIEKDSVQAFMSGVEASFEDQEQFQGTTKDREVDGHYAELLDCSFVLEGEPLDCYVLTVATNDGIVSMMMASTDGSYSDQYRSIIDSVQVED